MPIPRFSEPATEHQDAPFYARDNTRFVRILQSESKKRGLRVSVYFDGFLFHPLLETIDAAGNPTSGRLLRPNVRLVRALAFVDETLNEMSSTPSETRVF
jgi:hypothetical protein